MLFTKLFTDFIYFSFRDWSAK